MEASLNQHAAQAMEIAQFSAESAQFLAGVDNNGACPHSTLRM
jgi:hypothetical protein